MDCAHQANLHKHAFFQEILRAGAPSRHTLRGGLAQGGRDPPEWDRGWGDARRARGLGAARWDRRQRKPPGSPRRSSALPQGLGWHVEQLPVNGRGRRRGGKAACRLLAATAAEALPSVWETRTCEPASALQAPRCRLRLTRPPGRSCATRGVAEAGAARPVAPRNSESSARLGPSRTRCRCRGGGATGALRPETLSAKRSHVLRRRARADRAAGPGGRRLPPRRRFRGRGRTWCREAEGPAGLRWAPEAPGAACSLPA